MAFTVTDFPDFLRVLRANPEWQIELRRILVEEALARIDASVDRLVAALQLLAEKSDERAIAHEEEMAAFHAEMAAIAARQEKRDAELAAFKVDVDTRFDAVDARFDASDARFDAVDARFDAVDARFDAVDARFDASDARFDRVETRLDQHDAQLHALRNDTASIKGRQLEGWYQDRATGVFGHLLNRVRVVFPGAVPELQQALREGDLTSAEWEDVRRLDLLIEGVDHSGLRRRIAMEISFHADADDVERAVRRAATVARAGVPCMPAVGTVEVDSAVLALATEQGVGLLRDGDIVNWPS